jgi:hypothetical protein
MPNYANERMAKMPDKCQLHSNTSGVRHESALSRELAISRMPKDAPGRPSRLGVWMGGCWNARAKSCLCAPYPFIEVRCGSH